MRIRSDEHKARHREEMRRYRAAALAAGLCTSCTARLRYLADLGLTVAKSACVFCPYRSWESWKMLPAADMARAVEYDRSIRDARKDEGYNCFVHRSFTPLEGAVDDRSTRLFDDETAECEGVCFT